MATKTFNGGNDGGKRGGGWGWLLGLPLAGLGLLIFLLLTSTVNTNIQQHDHTDESTPTPTPGDVLELYHYTDCPSADAIVASGVILPSIASQGGFATFGDGQYLSDLPPNGIAKKEEYSLLLFNSPRVQYKTECWLLIRVRAKESKRVRTVYTVNVDKVLRPLFDPYSLFLRAGQTSLTLDLVKRGKTIYHP